ncbi:MAG: YgjV family protein [Clostridia bacterium]|nr:YgjV family protein [Clostridia bacterium]
MELYISYGFSFLTVIIAIVVMQFKNMTWILLGHITTNLLTALSYVFVGGWSGSGICFIAIAQTLTMYFYNRKSKSPHWIVILFFIAAYITCSAILFRSVFDIFSAAAAVCFALAVTQKKSLFFRCWYALDMLFWSIYDVSCKQYANLILHTVLLISSIISMIRIDGIFRKRKVE